MPASVSPTYTSHSTGVSPAALALRTVSPCALASTAPSLPLARNSISTSPRFTADAPAADPSPPPPAEPAFDFDLPVVVRVVVRLTTGLPVPTACSGGRSSGMYRIRRQLGQKTISS